MAKDDKAQSTPQGAASTVALENLAESIAKATLRALDERQLAAGPGGTVHLPIGDGTTVLGIYIPPCKPGESFGLGGLPCHHHLIMGIIIIPGLHNAIETAGTSGQETLK